MAAIFGANLVQGKRIVYALLSVFADGTVSFNSTQVRRYVDVGNCDAAAALMSAGAAKYLQKFRGSKKPLIPLPHADGS